MGSDDAMVRRIQATIDQLHEFSWRNEVFSGSDPPMPDVYISIALLQATWIRGRHLIEFLLNLGGNTIRGRDLLESWSPDETLPADLLARLVDYRTHTSKHVMHLLHAPPGDGGYRAAMVTDVFEAFRLFLGELEEADSPHATPLRQQLEWIEKKKALPLVEVMRLPGGPWSTDRRTSER